MMGLLAPSIGSVLVNGTVLHQIGVRNYRKCIAAVMQNDCLLAGSIAENICFFEVNRDNDRIEKCAQLAGIADDIERMPMRYHALVGDMGSTLSGGQQQRIFLARALYARPEVLFLDEATSHLDLKKESEISESIKNLGITRVVIAHRQKTIESADRIIHLPVGTGTNTTDVPNHVKTAEYALG